MMNLEKMKQKKRTITKSRVKKSLLAATTFLCLTTPLLQTQTAYAGENTTPAITIEKPDGWKQGETTIAVTVDASHMPEGFSIAKIEAKAGKDGSWQDVKMCIRDRYRRILISTPGSWSVPSSSTRKP